MAPTEKDDLTKVREEQELEEKEILNEIDALPDPTNALDEEGEEFEEDDDDDEDDEEEVPGGIPQ